MNGDPLTCGGVMGSLDIPVVPRQSPQVTDATTLAELKKLPMGEVMRLLVGPVVRTSVREYGPKGNIFFRAMMFPQVGDSIQGHAHHYDHVTYLRRGALNVVAWKVDPKTGEPTDEKVIDRSYAAPCAILIKREWAHQLTALMPETEADCVFALRDSATGEVADDWDGSLDPYC